MAGVAERAEMAIARLEDYFDAVESHVAERKKTNETRVAAKQEPLPDEKEQYALACSRCDEGVTIKNAALKDDHFLTALAEVRNTVEGEQEQKIRDHPAFDGFDAAMHCFRDAIQKGPKLSRAHFEMGLCLVLLGRFGLARGYLNAAALYSPNNLAALNLQGEVLLELGQWEEAVSVFKRVLLLENESGRANLGLARAYAGLQADVRQCQDGLDALERAMQLGTRDRRMVQTQVLVLNDGREVDGVVTFDQEKNIYSVMTSSGSNQFPAAEVKELIKRKGLREHLMQMAERFERGEKRVQGPVLRGTNRREKREKTLADPWKDTPFGK
jgi:tetratricopeptide (TPR) repeat protein